jgi:gas vesicle structural protein
MTSGGGYLERPAPSGLADVVEVILDKGIVLDAYVRVSLLGIELLTLDARIVVASVDTYLRFAEATNRLDLNENAPRTLPDLVEEGAGAAVEHVAAKVVENKVGEGVEKIEEAAEKVGGVAPAIVEGVENVVGSVVEAVIPEGEK